MDERAHYPCCKSVSEDELANDPEPYDCETCPVLAAEHALWPENARAWDTYRQLATRFVVDAGLGSDAFQALTADLDAPDRLDLLARLALIYDEVQPPKLGA